MLAMKDWFQITYLSEGAGGGPGPLALLGTWITLIVGIVSLFEKGEEAMTQESQRVVRNWLLRDNLAEEGANWADSFKDLFDAVFTKHHLSWTCFSRSVLASATIITGVILGMIGFGFTSMYRVSQVALIGRDVSVYVGALSAIGTVASGDPLARASLISTFFTPIWIWLYAIAGLALQGSTSVLQGFDWMRELFDVENRPVHALGLMIAGLSTAAFLLAIPFAL